MKNLSNIVTNLKPSGIREFFNYASEMPNIASLGVGEPDFTTPKPITIAARESLNKGRTFYTSNQGLPILRQKISDYLSERFGISYYKDEIILTSGSSQGILMALLAIINRGDEVIVTEPAYICYGPDIEMCGGTPTVITLSQADQYKLKPSTLKKHISPKTKALILSYPNNPTGATMSKDDLLALSKIILKHDLYVISDEIYAELTYGHRHFSIASIENKKKRTILISGFSKAFAMTGWRLGYVCAEKEILDQILKIQQHIMLSAPTMSQYGAIAALDYCLPEVENMVGEYNKRRIFLLKELERLGIDFFRATGAFYLFVSIKKFGFSSRDFCIQMLNNYKVLVVPGTAFGDDCEGYIRVSYATSKSNLIRFIEALEDFTHKNARSKNSGV